MTATTTPHPDPAAVPLVGREREQVLLREVLAAAIDGHGSLVLIGGEAGIGKTALAEWLCSEAGDAGALVLVGRCYDLSETPPYGPWREAFERAPRGDGLPALPSAVLPADGAGESLASQEAIVARVRDYLAALAARRPLVLLLDDLHWADPASLNLSRFFARQLAALPILLVGTYRADEIGQEHPLFAVLPLLARESHAARLDLRPLDRGAIGALVAGRYVLTEADRERLADYLAGRTEGNALFLGELLRTLEGEGLLRGDGAGWAVGDLGGVPVPALLRQVIAGRAARLEPETQRLLAVGAVIGQEVPLAAWAAVAEVGEDALLAHAERALAARLLAELPDGTGLRFPHALIREALYAGVPALRRRGVHRRAGEVLAADLRPDPDAVAHHFRQAGDPRAGEWLEHAADRAHRAYAWLTAADRLATALALAEQRGAAADERAWLSLRLGLLRRHGDTPTAAALLATAAEQADLAGDPALAACARFNAGQARCWLGEFRAGVAAMAAATAARAAAPPDEATRARLRSGGLADDPDHYRGTLALWQAYTGLLAPALALGERVVAGLGAPPPVGWLDGAYGPDALRAVGVVQAWLGRPAEARAALERNRAAHRAAGDHGQAGVAAIYLLWLVLLPYAADDLGGRRHLAAEAERDMARAGGVGGYFERIQLAAIPLLAGDWDEVRVALPAYAALNHHMRQTYAHALAPLAAYQGDRALARQLLNELPAGAATPPGDMLYQAGLALLRLGATLALDDADLPAVRSWLEAYDRWLAWSGAVLGRAEGALGWAAYHRAAGDPGTARQQAERALAHATEPRQPLALLAAHRALGELDTEAGTAAAAQMHLDAALALAEACAAPYERALALLALADLRAATGDRDGTRGALDEARAICLPLAARPALARADALAARLLAAPDPASVPLPFGLTAREAAVLRLVAEGLTDPQIAERLFVSRHTVNTHLRGIYGKLGVGTRTAAARLATERGLA